MSRLTRAQNRMFDRMRAPEAFRAAAEREPAPRTADFSSLAGHRYALLVTYRRSGEGVPTPIWFGLDGERVWIATEADSAKVRRLRRDPRVRIGPCDSRGKPFGPLADGTARIVPADGSAQAEAKRAESAIQAGHGLGRRVYEATVQRGTEGVYLEISAAG